MKEILFRGQTRRFGEKVRMNGEKVPSNWVYGGVCHGKGAFSIIYGSMDVELEQPTEKHVVYSDTVGQYTGLTDKNGKKIFEGDIVKAQDDVFGSPFCNGIIGKIIYEEAAFFIETQNIIDSQYLFNECAVYEVIGNIHDNPELLKGADDNE